MRRPLAKPTPFRLDVAIPCAAPAGYFDLEQPFASRLDIGRILFALD
jgi:hypothetical protein